MNLGTITTARNLDVIKLAPMSGVPVDELAPMD